VTLWRIYHQVHGPGLDGQGGTVANGRWHKRGHPVTYFSDSPSLAVLEKLIHLDPDLLPGDLVLGAFESQSEPLRIEAFRSLPADWAGDEIWTQNTGSAWLKGKNSALLSVPSIVVPEQRNVVLNPLHPEARSIKLVRTRSFQLDPRLLK
jgi:RES domain-containing protein